MAKKRFSETEWRKVFAELNQSGTSLGLPAQRVDSFVAASWNLRQFGGIARKTADRSRDIEAYRFIASVIQRFDLVALQEIKEDLASLRQLHVLLPDFDLIVSDTTGNFERLAFLYRRGKVRQTDLAAEADIPMDVIQKNMRARWKQYRDAFADFGSKIEANPRFKGRIVLPDRVGFERAPHCVSFAVGPPGQELPLLAFNTHIFYGQNRDDRTDDFLAFLEWLYERWSHVEKIFSPNFLIFGDMNAEVASGDRKTSRRKIQAFIDAADQQGRKNALARANKNEKALVRSQVTLFPFVKGTRWLDPPKIGSNLDKDEFYDQIILMARTLEKGGQGLWELGVFDIPTLVGKALGRRMTAAQKSYQKDRIKQQLSDHLPIWVRVELGSTPVSG